MAAKVNCVNPGLSGSRKLFRKCKNSSGTLPGSIPTFNGPALHFKSDKWRLHAHYPCNNIGFIGNGVRLTSGKRRSAARLY